MLGPSGGPQQPNWNFAGMLALLHEAGLWDVDELSDGPLLGAEARLLLPVLQLPLQPGHVLAHLIPTHVVLDCAYPRRVLQPSKSNIQPFFGSTSKLELMIEHICVAYASKSFIIVNNRRTCRKERYIAANSAHMPS